MDEMNDANFDSSFDGVAIRPAEQDELDVLLDRALLRYTAGEPRPGFATRMLASARAARQRRPRAERAWAIAASGYAIAAVAVVLMFRAQHIEIVIGAHPSNSEIAQVTSRALQPSLTPVMPATARAAPLSQPPAHAAIHVHVHARRPEQSAEVQSIDFAPIVIAPIRISAMH